MNIENWLASWEKIIPNKHKGSIWFRYGYVAGVLAQIYQHEKSKSK